MKYSKKNPPDGIDLACELTKYVATRGMNRTDSEKTEITIDFFGSVLRLLVKFLGWVLLIILCIAFAVLIIALS